MEGLYQALASTGTDLVMLREESRKGLPKLVAQRAVDGVVVITHPHDELLRFAAGIDTPCVAVNMGEVPGINTVAPDSTTGVRQAMEHLAALGHQRVAYVNTWLAPSQDHRPTVETRLRAFLTAAAEMDLRALPGSDAHVDVAERVATLMESDAPPTALVCYSDGGGAAGTAGAV